ncbi:MAG: Gfo/Idh/MocA family oxidoreductase, partial [Kiritimatiellae bacterium]|nr:Gfo/Idh/MocA family oxidoreductase [Kiritimatiellia bacterium]
TPFYSAIRRRVLDGEIGDLVNLQTVEHVSYHHMAVAYVRGKWNRRARCGSSMLLAKCCHDLDLLAWMKSGVAPTSVGSFGGLMQFRPDQAPPGAGTRCLVDCPIEAQCDYSARKHYLDISNPFRWSSYTWAGLEGHGLCLTDTEIRDLESMHPEFPWREYQNYPIPPPEVRSESLKTDNPHGRCVWRCDNDVVDHQSVLVQFADGATATHNMVGGTARPMRSIHLLGTRGEIQGVFEEERFTIRHADPRHGHEFKEEVVDVRVGGDMSGALGDHGGGDSRLVLDFVRTVRGEAPSLSCTALEDSVWGHRMVFAADQAMETHRIIDLAADAADSIS